MLYDLSDHYTNTFDVLRYTVSAMKDVGFSNCEIDDYLDQATTSNNKHLIDVSIEFVNKCNEVANSYHSSAWEFGCESDNPYYCEDEDSEYYEGFTNKESSNCTYDSEDCYEGFDSCKRRYYWENDNLEF